MVPAAGRRNAAGTKLFINDYGGGEKNFKKLRKDWRHSKV
jgi:hypothetical protein